MHRQLAVALTLCLRNSAKSGTPRRSSATTHRLGFFSFYLTQSSGSRRQSARHRKRCHDNQPIGGVRANPLSSARTADKKTSADKQPQQPGRRTEFILAENAGPSRSTPHLLWPPSMAPVDRLRLARSLTRRRNTPKQRAAFGIRGQPPYRPKKRVLTSRLIHRLRNRHQKPPNRRWNQRLRAQIIGHHGRRFR